MQYVDFSQLELNPFTTMGDEGFLITAGSPSSWNTMAAGWGALGYVWEKPAAFIFVRQSRYTLEFLKSNDLFTLSFFPPELKGAIEFCGMHSGRNTDKAEGASITPVEIDGAVSFEEANLILLCRKVSMTVLDASSIVDPALLKHYPQCDWHDMFIVLIEKVYIS